MKQKITFFARGAKTGPLPDRRPKRAEKASQPNPEEKLFRKALLGKKHSRTPGD